MRSATQLALLLGCLALAACPDPVGDDDSAWFASDDDDSASGADDDDSVVSDDDDSVASDDDDATEPPYGPALYPADRVHSPIPSYTADVLRATATAGAADVFMKVGDSHTVTWGAMPCFAGSSVDLGDHAELQSTLDFFLGGDAAGSTPFDRESHAALGGMTASWAISGDPSPIEQEIDAIGPRFALVQYGTNDMGMGYTYASATRAYYEDMVALLDGLTDQGIVPALMAIPRRGDDATADWWVPAWNDVIRGLARSRQLPFIDLHLALQDLPGQGLAGDGVHMSTGGGGCDLTGDGLLHGNNVRNLAFLQALDRLLAVAIEGEPSLDPDEPLLAGAGSPGSPFEVPSLPFTHLADTSASPHSNLDLYTGCASDADESGPEYLYRLELDEPTRLRVLVLDLPGVDIDVHLLDGTATEEGCLERDHHLVETTLDPGTYHLALDSWVDGAEVLDGEYMVVVTTCHPDDPACD